MTNSVKGLHINDHFRTKDGCTFKVWSFPTRYTVIGKRVHKNFRRREGPEECRVLIKDTFDHSRWSIPSESNLTPEEKKNENG